MGEFPYVMCKLYVYCTDYTHRMQMSSKPDANTRRIGFNIPEELAEKLETYCKQNFTNKTEAFKAWIKGLPVDEKSVQK